MAAGKLCQGALEHGATPQMLTGQFSRKRLSDFICSSYENQGQNRQFSSVGVTHFPSSSSSTLVLVNPNTFRPLRVLLLCTAAIQRIEAPGQNSRLAVITPNKKQTLKHMVPLDETPRDWEGNVVFPTFQVV